MGPGMARGTAVSPGHETCIRPATGTEHPARHKQRLAPKPKGRLTAKSKSAADRRGVVRYYRHDTVITGWTIRRELPGRIKLKNPALFRKGELLPGDRAGVDGDPGD